MESTTKEKKRNFDILIEPKRGDFRAQLAVTYLDWDSRFFNKKIGSLEILNENLDEADLESALVELHEKAKVKEYDCLYVKVPSTDVKVLNLLERHGYLHRDTLVTLIYDLEKDFCHAEKSDYTIRLFKPEDMEAISNISISEYNHSRFFTDPYFAPKAREMYSVWIQNDARSTDTDVWVIEKQGEISGYISCINNYGDKEGIINLVAINKEDQRKSLGKVLLGHSIESFRNKGMISVKVGTHLSNTGAVNFYIKYGFKVLRSEYRLHKWFE